MSTERRASRFGPDTEGTDAAYASRHDGGSWRSSAARYYSLTKPGVLYGNALTTVAGYLFGARGHPVWGVFVAVTVGSTLLIASATVLNNVLDRDIDQRMARTRTRATVTGAVNGRRAVVLSVCLGLCGVAILVLGTNALVVAAGILGFFTYVVLYGMLSKRLSVHGTLVGAVSGAVPILAGYLAAAGHLNPTAGLLFLALFFWQLPEFYAIAIYRVDEYREAGIPVISVVRGTPVASRWILVYTCLYAISTVLVGVAGNGGVTYTLTMGIEGALWVVLAARGLRHKDPARWARLMFRISLVSILTLCLLLGIAAYLP